MANADIAIDAAFDFFGIDIVVDPGGIALSARALKITEDELEDFGLSSAHVSTLNIFMRDSEMLTISAALGRDMTTGDVIEVSGSQRTIQSVPRYYDPLRKLVVIDAI